MLFFQSAVLEPLPPEIDDVIFNVPPELKKYLASLAVAKLMLNLRSIVEFQVDVLVFETVELYCCRDAPATVNLFVVMLVASASYWSQPV